MKLFCCLFTYVPCEWRETAIRMQREPEPESEPSTTPEPMPEPPVAVRRQRLPRQSLWEPPSEAALTRATAEWMTRGARRLARYA